MDPRAVENTNIELPEILITPSELKREIPISDKARETISDGRKAIANILSRKDVPGKLSNCYGWNEEVILTKASLAVFNQLVQLGDDPLVSISQLCRFNYRKTGKKPGYIPKFSEKLFR